MSILTTFWSGLNIRFNDQLLQKDQFSEVQFSIDYDSKNRVLGFLLGLEGNGIDILNVRAIHNNASILNNSTPAEFKISSLDLDYEESIELEIEIKANKTILLSQALTISPETNEGVNSVLEELQFKLLPQRISPREFKAYPNPTDTELIVDIPTEFIGGTISLSNILGKRIWNEKVSEAGQMVISKNFTWPPRSSHFKN
ncbi:MAG: hypothetical protein ACJA01_002375 [Saprospiraceae bacterium]|jgi:hypothetical protein